MRLVSLEIKYGDRTLFSNLNLEMEKGLLWIVGPSGSGKSTLLSLIEGSRQPTKGKIVLEEEEQNVCYCGTESTLFPEESFLTNARLLLGLRKLTQKQKDLVDAFSFRPWLDKKILSLSGGERKKAELLLLFSLFFLLIGQLPKLSYQALFFLPTLYIIQLLLYKLLSSAVFLF